MWLCQPTLHWLSATQEGLYNKAIKALTSEGLAQPGPEILEEMLNKHPQV